MSAILENWVGGSGLPDCLVIDGHVHIGEWPHATTFGSADEAVEETAAYMDANGVDAACVQSGGYFLEGADYRLGNDFLLEVCGRLPDRLIPFMCVNPNDARENVLAELDHLFGQALQSVVDHRRERSALEDHLLRPRDPGDDALELLGRRLHLELDEDLALGRDHRHLAPLRVRVERHRLHRLHGNSSLPRRSPRPTLRTVSQEESRPSRYQLDGYSYSGSSSSRRGVSD